MNKDKKSKESFLGNRKRLTVELNVPKREPTEIKNFFRSGGRYE